MNFIHASIFNNSLTITLNFIHKLLVALIHIDIFLFHFFAVVQYRHILILLRVLVIQHLSIRQGDSSVCRQNTASSG